MIQSDLLRFKIDYKNDKIYPLLCTIENQSKEYEVACKIIEIFDTCYKNKINKERLGLMIKELEYFYKDYKLIRGLFSLLEKKSHFTSAIEDFNFCLSCNKEKKYDFNKNHISTEKIKNLTPATMRSLIFEESSLQSIAISEIKRQEILKAVANKLQTTEEIITKIMWSDLDENLIIQEYEKISPISLLVLYNISLIQTLLFDCLRIRIKMNSKENSGTLWKALLRKVKRMGLMYWLELDTNLDETTNTKSNILCTIEGALNVLKLTDRYGIAIAKIIPDIFQAEYWELSADIIRIDKDGKKVLYVFEMNVESNPNIISSDIIRTYYNNINNINTKNKIDSQSKTTILTHKVKKEKNLQITDIQKKGVQKNQNTTDANSHIPLFDSDVEKNFYQKFKSFDNSWNISREPEPLITKQKAAFIPDFVLTRFKNKVIVEIIGFWTKDYLVRKIDKITQIMDTNKEERFFMILIVNFDNLASFELNKQDQLLKIKGNDKILIIPYKRNNIPFGEIITFLKMIDSKYIHQYLNEITKKYQIESELDNILDEFKNSEKSFLTIGQLNKAVKYSIKENEVHENINIKDILKDNREFRKYMEEKVNDKKLIIIKDHIFKQSLFQEILIPIKNVKLLTEATELLKSKEIPEDIHIDILMKMGFEVKWNGLDYSNAVINFNKNIKN